jgi:hypothetical protein
MFFAAHYQLITNFEKKNLKKSEKYNFEKMSIFGPFGEKRLWTPQVGGPILWWMVILWLLTLKYV